VEEVSFYKRRVIEEEFWGLIRGVELLPHGMLL